MVLFTSNVVIRLQVSVIWPVYRHYYLMTVTVIWSALYDVAGHSLFIHIFFWLLLRHYLLNLLRTPSTCTADFIYGKKITTTLKYHQGQKVSVWVTHRCALRDAVQCSVLCWLSAWRYMWSWGGCRRPGSLHAAAPETHGSPIRQSKSHTVVLAHHCITCLLNQVV